MDVALRYPAHLVEGEGTPEQVAAIQWMSANLRDNFHCDSYAFPVYPDSDPLFFNGEWLYGYWLRQFGFSRQTNVKGIAVIDLKGNGK